MVTPPSASPGPHQKKCSSTIKRTPLRNTRRTTATRIRQQAVCGPRRSRMCLIFLFYEYVRQSVSNNPLSNVELRSHFHFTCWSLANWKVRAWRNKESSSSLESPCIKLGPWRSLFSQVLYRLTTTGHRVCFWQPQHLVGVCTQYTTKVCKK